MRCAFADNQQNRAIGAEVGANDVAFAVNRIKFAVQLPEGLDLPLLDINTDDVREVAAADDGAAYPWQGFDLLFDFLEIQAENVCVAA